MANHPNRSRGRPPIAEADRRKTIGISLSPETIALFDDLGAGKHRIADDLLNAALKAR